MNVVEIEIYRDSKKSFSLLRILLHDWRKIEIFHDRSDKKKTKLIQQDKLCLMRRKHVVPLEEELDNELEK